MKIGTTWRTRCCVTSARTAITAILLLSIFVQTRQQQRDVKSKWNNQLLPTNSVYEKAQAFVSPSENGAPSLSPVNENNVMENSKSLENSSSYENENSEEVYDDDYVLDETRVNDEWLEKTPGALPIAPSSMEHAAETKNKESSIESFKDSSINHDDDSYYYYDDYENATNQHSGFSEHDAVEYFDSSEDVAVSLKPEQHSSEASSEGSQLSDSSRAKFSISDNSSVDTLPAAEKTVESRVDEINREESNDDERPLEKSTDSRDDEILIGEAVVSVVTTKSVVNGTFSIPVSFEPLTTEQIISPLIPSSTPDPGLILSTDMSETTEDSRIVASVQTSRSISGARFLPFLVVQSIDKDTNEKNADVASSPSPIEETTESIEKPTKIENEDENLKIFQSTTSKRSSLPAESTESIIDKLDRVQSELSSGFLANGFRTSGNTLQLDGLSEQRPLQARKSFTTTSRVPIISKFVPRRYNQERKASGTVAAAGKPTESPVDEESTASTEKIKFRWPSSSRNSRPTVVENKPSSSNNNNKNNNRSNGVRGSNSSVKTSTSLPVFSGVGQDLSAFLPPGYKLKKEDSHVTEKSLLGEILAKSKFDISSLLPANYNAPAEETRRDKAANNEEKNVSKTTSNPSSLPTDGNDDDGKIDDSSKTTEKSAKPEKSLQDLFAKTSVDISALLPPDYNRFKSHDKVGKSVVAETSTTAETPTLGTTPRALGGIKLVFPSRPGGRKAPTKFTSTTHSSKVEGSGAVTPRIQKGWPTRATTEFTGWPTPSTTPISIEKLLEAARTATVASMNVSMVTMTEASSTTSTSTTTTTTTRPTTPGICENECEVAGTIRIVGNATWVPELLDRNTQEWQQLAEDIEKEMNLVFLKSSVFRNWFKHVRIDAFSPGSVLVDYFVELTELTQRINTQELKVIFHDSLRTYNSDVWNETRAKGPIKLGAFVLDPKSTDFVVIPKVNYPQQIQDEDRLIPQWAIAVIVIGVGGLLFIIVFGVSVLVNRQNASKLKPGPVIYTEEIAKNIIQTSHAAASHRSSQEYPKSEISTIWNDTDVWRDKSFESNSNEILVDGTLGRERNVDRRSGERKYNMYDSWRSEWNGYYYNPSQSSKFAGYESTTNLSRHPPDYDTNF